MIASEPRCSVNDSWCKGSIKEIFQKRYHELSVEGREVE
jgi:hypothetical protein